MHLRGPREDRVVELVEVELVLEHASGQRRRATISRAGGERAPGEPDAERGRS